jgi:hypothetical protein
MLLVIGETFMMAAAGACKPGLHWPDFVALILPPVAMPSLVASFLFLHWAIALVLTIALFAAVVRTVGALLKLPLRKQFR